MPYVEVWVDEADCGPCPECEARDDDAAEDARNVAEIIREWHFAKSRGDYELFERFLQSLDAKTWDFVLYGDPWAAPPTSETVNH